MSSYPPAMPTPALDFLRKVEVWQQAPGGMAGIAVALPEGDATTLALLLDQLLRSGPSAQLETRARYWLIGYREMNPPLTREQAGELDAVIERSARLPHAQPRRRHPQGYARMPRRQAATLALILAVVAAVSLALLIPALTRSPANPVQPAANAPQYPGQQQVPAGTTDLQQFEADWAPFTQLAASQQHPQTGAPALLFLRDGGYYVTKWEIPAGDPAWAPDLGGNVTAVDIRGNWAVITDADGGEWVVGTGQPFVLARNPGTVLRAGPDGTIWAIPEAHAIALRHRI